MPRPKIQKEIQILLALALLISGLRLAYILYRRHREAEAKPVRPAAAKTQILPDDYAYLPPSGVYDADSARGLIGKTVWVRLGYNSAAYRIAGGMVLPARRAKALPLPPLTKLRIRGVLRQNWHGARGIFYSFDYQGALRAVEIGVENSGGSAAMQVDNLFFMANPRKIYYFWPPQTWNLIAHHQVAVGMTEAQTMLALGGAYSVSLGAKHQTYLFPGRHPAMEVTFAHRHVVSFHAVKGK